MKLAKIKCFLMTTADVVSHLAMNTLRFFILESIKLRNTDLLTSWTEEGHAGNSPAPKAACSRARQWLPSPSKNNLQGATNPALALSSSQGNWLLVTGLSPGTGIAVRTQTNSTSSGTTRKILILQTLSLWLKTLDAELHTWAKLHHLLRHLQK